jgi:hypothetical protein
MNIYELAVKEVERQKEQERLTELILQARQEEYIGLLIDELPRLIPDGLEWLWNYSDEYYPPYMIYQESGPKINLSIGGNRCHLSVFPRTAGIGGNGLVLYVRRNVDEGEETIVRSDTDEAWTSGFIFDEIIYTVAQNWKL